jgi:sodium-independent sulfate anion transporter 11
VILDFQGVRYVDATGIEALKAMKTELRTYAGEGVEIRFVGLRNLIVGKLERAGWSFIDQGEVEGSAEIGSKVVLYQRLNEAIYAHGDVYENDSFKKGAKVELEDTH